MGRGPEGESPPPLLGGSGAQHVLGVMIHFRPQMSVLLRLSSPVPRGEACPCCHPQRLPSPHRCPSGGHRPGWLALLASTAAQTCCRGPLLHQAVTCVGRTRGGQFCSLCVLHGLRCPGSLVSWWRGRWAGTQGVTGRAAGLGGFFQSSVTPSSRGRRLTQCPPYPLSPSGIPWASPPAGPSSPSCPRPRAERGWICPRAGGVWEGVGPVCHTQPGGYCPFVGVARGWRLVSLGKHHRRAA